MQTTLKLLFLYFVLITLTGCNNRPENQFEIQGTITNNPNQKEKIYYLYSIGTELCIDSVKITNNKFTIVDTLSHPAWIFISDEFNNLHSPQEYLKNVNTYCFIEPKQMQADVDLDNWESFKLTGSRSQDELIILDSEIVPIWKNLNTLYQSDPSTEKFIREKDSLTNAEMLLTLNFIKTYPTSYVSLYRMTYMYKIYKANEQTVMDSIFWAMPSDMQNSDIGKELQGYIGLHNPEEGAVFPINFTLESVNGDSISLANVIKDKKYILLDFWASWCSPCRADIPNLKKLYNKYHSKGFEIVAISIDTDSDKWHKAIQEDKSNQWIQVIEPAQSKTGKESIVDTYNIMSYPSKILIDNTGKILAVWKHSNNSEINLDTFLKENLK